jgi:leucyl-tRNA synthetase
VVQKYQLRWEEDKVFEVDAPTLEEFPLGSISADELREKYVDTMQ